MERLLSWYRVSSSGIAVAGLVLANLVPLAGVLLFGWNLWTILAIYWVENGIVGFYNVLKMVAVAGIGKLGVIPFFLFHYGMFWLVHGVFVFTLPRFLGPGPELEPGPLEPLPVADPTTGGADLGNVALAAVLLLISHGVSYYLNFIRGGEFRRTTAMGLMAQPYKRVVVLHVTIVFGAAGIAMTGAPVVALLILIAVKTVIDVGLHLAEHRSAASAGS